MNESLNSLFKFFLIIFLILILGFFSYYYFPSSEFSEAVSPYQDKALFKTCPNSPEVSYLECFRKDFGKILSHSSPVEYLHIFNLEKFLYETDLFKSSSEKDKILIEILHAENWDIISDYLNNFKLKRNKMSFFQIVYLPVLKILIGRRFENTKEEIQKIWVKYKNSKELDPLLKSRWEKAL